MADEIQDEISLSITTQGDTSTASQVTVTSEQLPQLSRDLVVRARVCDDGDFDNATNATIAPVSNKGTTLKSHTSTKDIEVKSPAGVQATGTLTLTGVVPDGETVTVGSRVYEFDTDNSFTQGNYIVDVSARATASQGTLTVDTQPTADDTMTIGSTAYTFKASQSGPTEIAIGANLAATQANIVARINGTDDYKGNKNAVASAAAFSSDASVITARKPGTAGDSIATTETFTAGTNVFDAATLGTTTAGVDCSAANAVTDLVAAITADPDAVVTAADGAGDTVVLTAKTAGADANSYATTETLTNGSFGGATLSGGVSSTPGVIVLAITDATAETVTLRIGPPEFGGAVTDYSQAEIDITHAAP